MLPGEKNPEKGKGFKPEDKPKEKKDKKMCGRSRP